MGDQLCDIGRLCRKVGRAGEIEQFADDPIQPVHLRGHDPGGGLVRAAVGKFASEIAGHALDGTQGVPNFMGHTGGQPAQGGHFFGAPDLFLQLPDFTEVA